MNKHDPNNMDCPKSRKENHWDYVCLCPAQKEECMEELIKNLFAEFLPSGEATTRRFSVKEIRTLISQAEARGREATITEFIENIKDMPSATRDECYNEKVITEYELLSYASSLKSNAPKV